MSSQEQKRHTRNAITVGLSIRELTDALRQTELMAFLPKDAVITGVSCKPHLQLLHVTFESAKLDSMPSTIAHPPKKFVSLRDWSPCGGRKL